MHKEALATSDFIRAAYKVLLDREIEGDHVVDTYRSLGMSAKDVLVAIATSAEYSKGKIIPQPAEEGPVSAQLKLPEALTSTKEHKGLDQLCALFKRYAGPGTSGFFTDFLGVKTRLKYLPDIQQYDGAVFGYPSGQKQGLSFDLAEWEATLRSVVEAKDRIVIIELGAGWGPWLVTGAIAAQQRGIEDVQLAGVEGSEGHFGYLLQHLTDNGIDPARHFLFHGIIGTQDGFAYFPKLPDPQQDWGAQAITAANPAQPANETNGQFIDYRGLAFASLEKVPSLSLTTLLKRYDYVNLVHCDIQDSEGDVIPSAFEEINRRVRRIVIGTHSRRSEGALLDVFGPGGWVLEADTPCQYVLIENRVLTTNDGVQVWANPPLAKPG